MYKSVKKKQYNNIFDIPMFQVEKKVIKEKKKRKKKN